MKKILIIVGVLFTLNFSVIADDNNTCYGRTANGGWYQGQYRGTERTISTNTNTTSGSSANTGNSATTDASLSTQKVGMSGNMTRTESTGASSSNSIDRGNDVKQICVPNSVINHFENK